MAKNVQNKILVVNNPKSPSLIENIGSKIIVRRFDLPKYSSNGKDLSSELNTTKASGPIRIFKSPSITEKPLYKIEKFHRSSINPCTITFKRSLKTNIQELKTVITKTSENQKDDDILQNKKRKIENIETTDCKRLIIDTNKQNDQTTTIEENYQKQPKENSAVNIFTNEEFQEIIEKEINLFKKENSENSSNKSKINDKESISTIQTDSKSCQTYIHSMILPGHFVSKKQQSINILELNPTNQALNLDNQLISSLPSSSNPVNTTQDKLKLKIFQEYKNSFYQDVNGNYQIHKAVMNEDLNFVKRQCMVIKARNLSIDVRNFNNETPLHIAILWANFDIVKLLLDYDANISIVDNQGNNSIHLAILSGNSKILKLLLKYQEKIKIDTFNDEGFTALHLAAKLKKFEECKMLINVRANVNLKDKRSGRTPLFHAIETCALEVIQLLLCTGASKSVPNFADIKKKTICFEQLLIYFNSHTSCNIAAILDIKKKTICFEQLLIYFNSHTSCNIAAILGAVMAYLFYLFKRCNQISLMLRFYYIKFVRTMIILM